jgi:hypothetical protein
VHGFDSLVEPKLDVVVTVQADSTLCPGWWAAVSAALLSGCKLVQAGVGDQLIVYTPEAIRRVGLYDERFVGICHHEGDFFLRASLALREAACIHDIVHSRVADASSAFSANDVLCNSPASGGQRETNATALDRDAARSEGCRGEDVFNQKWANCRTRGGKSMERDWHNPPYLMKQRQCIAAGKQPHLYQLFEANVDPGAPGY